VYTKTTNNYTYIIKHLYYQRLKTCKTHFPHFPTLLTVSRVRAVNIVRRPFSDSSHVTAP